MKFFKIYKQLDRVNELDRFRVNKMFMCEESLGFSVHPVPAGYLFRCCRSITGAYSPF